MLRKRIESFRLLPNHFFPLLKHLLHHGAFLLYPFWFAITSMLLQWRGRQTNIYFLFLTWGNRGIHLNNLFHCNDSWKVNMNIKITWGLSSYGNEGWRYWRCYSFSNSAQLHVNKHTDAETAAEFFFNWMLCVLRMGALLHDLKYIHHASWSLNKRTSNVAQKHRWLTLVAKSRVR